LLRKKRKEKANTLTSQKKTMEEDLIQHSIQQRFQRTQIHHKCSYVEILNSIVICFILGMSAYELYLYGTYKDMPCEENLSLWLLLDGILETLYASFIAFTTLFWNYLSQKSQARLQMAKWIFIFMQISLIVGLAILVSAINPEQHVCPNEMYNFVWLVLEGFFLIVGVILLIATLLCLRALWTYLSHRPYF